jgi:hypothetical protein
MPRLMNQGGDSDSESELFGGEEKICRNCHESDNTEDLIAPCQVRKHPSLLKALGDPFFHLVFFRKPRNIFMKNDQTADIHA